MSYIFSRNPGILTGLLFGILIAFFHGFSGAACVLGLHYVIQKSLTSTLGEVAHATQIISFSLITLLGIGMLVKNGLVMAAGHQSSQETGLSPQKDNKGTLIPWAMAVGLVPCPAVVMVVLCCLSMNQLGLGLLLAAFISLGMAATLSLVILSIIIAKQLPVNRLSGQKAQDFHTISGIVSGLAVTVLGSLFLMATLNS
jgi:ABC-type nickel/cobalt efflux system permease component RcnA